MGVLLQNIKDNLPELEELLDKIQGHWYYEDAVYRYYHHSFRKVYYIQEETKKIVKALRELAPEGRELINARFLEIVKDGTGKEFDRKHNKAWRENCASILEAFFHAKYFLEMVVKYGKKYDEAPELLDSGWASVLTLYGLR